MASRSSASWRGSGSSCERSELLAVSSVLAAVGGVALVSVIAAGVALSVPILGIARARSVLKVLTRTAQRLTLPGKMTVSTKLTTKGQVVIPKAMRDRLRWRPGTRLVVRFLPDGGLALDAAAVRSKELPADDPIERAFGAFRNCGADLLSALEADHRAELEDESP